MKRTAIGLVVALIVLASALIALDYAQSVFRHGDDTVRSQYFSYDPAETVVDARMLKNPERYSPALATVNGELWLAYLQFVPGEGDHIRLGRLRWGRLMKNRQLTDSPGYYARPTLANSPDGALWLTYEVQRDGSAKWQVHAPRRWESGMVFPYLGEETSRMSEG